jgi:hypothetical protein
MSCPVENLSILNTQQIVKIYKKFILKCLPADDRNRRAYFLISIERVLGEFNVNGNLVGVTMRHHEAVGDLDVALNVGAQQGTNHAGHFLIASLIRVHHGEQHRRVNFHFNWYRMHVVFFCLGVWGCSLFLIL